MAFYSVVMYASVSLYACVGLCVYLCMLRGKSSTNGDTELCLSQYCSI